MRERTRDLHSAAECSGVVARLLRGKVDRSGYALYLRNLLPAYQAMERALRQHRDHPGFDGLAHPSLYRTASIVSDLNTLNGPDWAESIPLLLSGRSYAERVEWAGTGALLLAHCYTRYLGDLNGGQLLQRCLVQSFGPDFKAVAFSRFPEIEDLETFRTTYRRSLDRAGSRLADVEDVVAEAAVAFRLNIQLSIEVGSVCLGSPA